MDKEAFNDLIRSVAASLPGKWRFDEQAQKTLHSRCSAEIIGDQGMRLYFRERWETKQNMVSVSCGWPRLGNTALDPHYVGALRHDDAYLGMNFSPKRTARSISNDIKRRLLTDYVKLYVVCLDAKRKRQETLEQIQYQCEQLRRVGKLRSSPHNNHYDSEVSLSRYFPSAGACSYRVSTYNGESRIELTSVPMDLAIKIAGLIDSHFDTESSE